jgi:hypothetical protein
MIYNLSSEVEQSIRINGHPTLVKTVDVEASAGAGAIALMPDNLDPALKPFLLTVSTDIGQIYTSINNLVDSIDKMANTGAVRATESRSLSGVAMETEFQLLNARLAEFADNLELAEEQIWRWYAMYQGTAFDGEIEYPDDFDVRDVPNALRSLQTIAGSIKTVESQALLEYRVRELLEDPRYEIQYEETREQAMYQAEIDEINKIQASLQSQQPVPEAATPAIDSELEEHPSLEDMSESDRQEHIQDMLMEGYSNRQILALHPELVLQDIIDAGTAAARDN